MNPFFIVFIFIFSSISLWGAAVREEDAFAYSTITARIKFEERLGELASILPHKRGYGAAGVTKKIFIAYAGKKSADGIDDAHKQWIEDVLCSDLHKAGFQEGQLLLADWSARPGGVHDTYSFSDEIFRSSKVLLIGSPLLKQIYENVESGALDDTIAQITNIRIRLIDATRDKKPSGIIPIYYSGEKSDNFPMALKSLRKRALGEKEYYSSFFDLLMDLFQEQISINPDNPIWKEQRNFLKQFPQERTRGWFFEEIGEEKEFLEKVTNTTPKHSLPDRNALFIARHDEEGEDYLFQLWKMLESQTLSTSKSIIITGATSLPSSSSIIAGLGGIGKTQLALAYAHAALSHHAYDFIGWIYSDTKERLLTSYKNILLDLDIVCTEKEERTIIRKLTNALNEKKKWLLIYDNVPFPGLLSEKIPQINGHTLITTKYSDSLEWKTISSSPLLQLDVYQLEEAIKYLLTSLGKEPTVESTEGARKVAETLDRLPLALSHAAAYIEQQKIDFDEYLRKYKNRREELLKYSALSKEAIKLHNDLLANFAFIVDTSYKPPEERILEKVRTLLKKIKESLTEEELDRRIELIGSFSDEQAKLEAALMDINNKSSVHTTFQMALDSIRSPIAQDIIKYASYLEPDYIPHWFFYKIPSIHDTDMDRESEVEDGIGELVKYSLVKNIGSESKATFSLHRLVQMVDQVLYPLDSIMPILEMIKSSWFSHPIQERIKILHSDRRKVLASTNIRSIYAICQNLSNHITSLERYCKSSEDKEAVTTFQASIASIKEIIIPIIHSRFIERLLMEDKQKPSKALSIKLLAEKKMLELEMDEKKMYQLAVDRGDSFAQIILADMQHESEGGSTNYEEIKRLLTTAAEKGDANAQYILGIMHYKGRGGEINYEEAKRLFYLAAEQGREDAQYVVGIMYDNGQGVEKDEVQAVAWYRRAAERGLAGAQFNLGVMYANGQGVEKDEAQAAEWYRRAADQGLADAQFNLGVMYANGQGVEKDEAQAAEWYRRAADQGVVAAQNNYGRGIAHEWLRKAAEKRLTAAQNNLGEAYLCGLDSYVNYRERRRLSISAVVDHKLNVNSLLEQGKEESNTRVGAKAASLSKDDDKRCKFPSQTERPAEVIDTSESLPTAAAQELDTSVDKDSTILPPASSISELTYQGKIGTSTHGFKITEPSIGEQEFANYIVGTETIEELKAKASALCVNLYVWEQVAKITNLVLLGESINNPSAPTTTIHMLRTEDNKYVYLKEVR